MVGNLFLFLPLGATLGLLGLTRRSATLLAGLWLLGSIEIAQLFIPGRTTSVDDVLLQHAQHVPGPCTAHQRRAPAAATGVAARCSGAGRHARRGRRDERAERGEPVGGQPHRPAPRR